MHNKSFCSKTFGMSITLVHFFKIIFGKENTLSHLLLNPVTEFKVGFRARLGVLKFSFGLNRSHQILLCSQRGKLDTMTFFFLL